VAQEGSPGDPSGPDEVATGPIEPMPETGGPPAAATGPTPAPTGPRGDPISDARSRAHRETTSQIRGSSLLLVGRTLSMAVNFLVQILIVRYLSTSDYGAFTYALSIAALGQTLITFGLDRGASRFLSIYDERGDYDRLLGTITMVCGTIVSLGAVLVVGVYLFQGWIAGSTGSAEAGSLLLILILLAPIQAVDDLLTGLLSVFASPRSIFLRRYIVGPGMRLLVVLLLIVGHSGVSFLAAGYVAAGAFGVALYVGILWQVLGRRGLLDRFRQAKLQIPWREILVFTIPLLTTDLFYVFLNSSDAIILERFSGFDAVAAWRVVQPAAGLNTLVISSFTLLFTPIAARLYARQDVEGVKDLYWRTAIWMAVISFPLFALTFSLAHVLTLLLYGARYADSATYLALLSFGYYFNTALGFNGLTLRIFGVIRYTVAINFLAAATNVILNLFLIPRYGALGAAIGTTLTLVIHNLLKQAGLRLGTGISIFERQHLRVYVIIAVAAIGLFTINTILSPHPIVQVGLAAIASLAVLMLNRHSLQMAQTFPEFRRLPFSRFFFGD
jgi:O-antigen/teichoic acid export membrane protein